MSDALRSFFPKDRAIPWLLGSKLQNKAYNFFGGGSSLRARPISAYPEAIRNRLKDRLVNPLAYKSPKFNDPAGFFEAVGPDRGIAPGALQILKGGDPSPMKEHGVGDYYENMATNPKRRRILAQFAKSDMQDREMRARNIRNALAVPQWGAAAGAAYGLVRSLPKLSVEKNLESEEDEEKVAGATEQTTHVTADAPWKTPLLAYPGDATLIYPAAAALSTLGGFRAVDWLTDKVRKKALENKRKAAEKEFQTLFASGVGLGPAKVASFALEQEKQANGFYEGFKALDPRAQAALISLPAGVSIMTYLAARDYAMSEAKKKKTMAELAINRARGSRPPVIEFASGAPGDVVRQGPVSSKYRAPIMLPAPSSGRAADEEEFDLQKMSTYIVKRAEDWDGPANGPGMDGPSKEFDVSSSNFGGTNASSPATQGAGGGASPAPGNVGAPGGMESQGQRFLPGGMANPVNIGASIGNWMKGTAGKARQAGVGFGADVLTTAFPNAQKADTQLGKLMTERPKNVLQWGAGSLLGNQNTAGYGGIGNLLGAMLPGNHPQMRQRFDQLPGQVGGWIDQAYQMFSPEATAAQSGG